MVLWLVFRFEFQSNFSLFNYKQIEYRMPNDAPHFVSKFFNIPRTASLNFVITTNVMSNSDEIRSYPLVQRNCYFSDERRLKYFKHYTQTNCEIECYFEKELQQCGCLPVAIESII
jgi:acid-sensing ion channel, other